MKSSTGVRVRGAARARRRVRAALQPAPSGPLPAHPPAGAGRPSPFLGKGISKSKPHGPCLFLFITHVTVAQGAGGACGWQFSVPSWAPTIGALPLWARRPAPVGSLLVWAKPWTSAPVLFLGGSVYAAPHVPGDPERRLPPSCVPRSCSLGVLRVSLHFCFCVFFFFHCTTARWGEGIP